MDIGDYLADPMTLQHWNAEQTILWAMYRDTDRLRHIFNMNVGEDGVISSALAPIWKATELHREWLTIAQRESEEKQIEYDVRAKYRDARSEIRRHAEAGRITVWGKKNGNGDPVEIPAVEWSSLEFHHYFYPRVQIGATANAKDGGHPCWLDLRFKREEVLALFPALNEDSEKHEEEPESGPLSAPIESQKEIGTKCEPVPATEAIVLPPKKKRGPKHKKGWITSGSLEPLPDSRTVTGRI